MANDGNEPGLERHTVGSDLLIPIAAIALAVYYFTTIIDSPWTAQVTAFFVGVILIGLSLLHIGRSLWRLHKGEARFTVSDLLQPFDMLPQRIALFALTVLSLVLMPTLGFTLTAILFLAGAMLLLNRGRTPVRIVSMAIAFSVVWFIVFVLIFQRRFPLGWLDNQISAVFKPLLKTLGLG